MGVPLRRRAGPSVYRETRSGPEVAAVVESAWLGQAGWVSSLRVFPDGCADLVWDGRALSVVATAAGVMRHEVAGTPWTVGLRLRCGTGGAVLGLPMPELDPGATPLSAVWGAPARKAEETLAGCATPVEARLVMESLVFARLRQGVELNGLSIAAARALRSPVARIADVAADLGVSERGLRRQVRHEVGVGPKELQRVLRFHRFLRRVGEVAQRRAALADVAAELGYADQSHLGRDCRRLSGTSPAALVRSWAPPESGRNVPDGAPC